MNDAILPSPQRAPEILALDEALTRLDVGEGTRAIIAGFQLGSRSMIDIHQANGSSGD